VEDIVTFWVSAIQEIASQAREGEVEQAGSTADSTPASPGASPDNPSPDLRLGTALPDPQGEKRTSRRQAITRTNGADMRSMVQAQLLGEASSPVGGAALLETGSISEQIDRRLLDIHEKRWGNVQESPQFILTLLRTKEKAKATSPSLPRRSVAHC